MPTLVHPPEAGPNPAGRLPPETPPKLGGHTTATSPTDACDFPPWTATPPTTDNNINRAAIKFASDEDDTSEEDSVDDIVTQCEELLAELADQDHDANPGVVTTDNNSDAGAVSGGDTAETRLSGLVGGQGNTGVVFGFVISKQTTTTTTTTTTTPTRFKADFGCFNHRLPSF